MDQAGAREVQGPRPADGHENSDGKSYWWVEGDKKFGTDNSIAFVHKNGKKIPYYGADMMGGPRDDIHAAASEAKPRVELLDEMGIYTQIVYPNIMGFAAPAMVQGLDRELSYVIVAIYNDAMAEWQDEGAGGCCRRRCCRSGTSSSRSRRPPGPGPRPHRGLDGRRAAPGWPARPRHAHWYPLYEVLSDLELPIDIHIGASNWKGQGGAAWPSLPERAAKPVRSIQTELSNSRFISNLCASDLLIRWPKLNWVSVESGIGWIPYVLERVDYEYREEFPEMGPPELPPAKELFQRGIYGTFWFEDAGPIELIPRIGADNMLWETDFPHPTSLYPSPVERSEEKLKDLDPACCARSCRTTRPSSTRSRSERPMGVHAQSGRRRGRDRRPRPHRAGRAPGRSPEELAVEAASTRSPTPACVRDLDGLIACKSVQGNGDDTTLGQLLGLNLPYVQTLDYGTCNFSLHLAVMAISGAWRTRSCSPTGPTRAAASSTSASRCTGPTWPRRAGLVHIAGPGRAGAAAAQGALRHDRRAVRRARRRPAALGAGETRTRSSASR